MKKLMILASAFLLVFGIVSSASALLFTLDSYDINLRDEDPGLVVYSADILAEPYTFDLEVGESETVDFFTIGSTERYTNSDDRTEYPITVSFDFSSPDVDVSSTGFTDGRWFFGHYGVVRWDEDPFEYTFGATGLFTVGLSDESWWLPGSDTVSLTLTYVSADQTAPVPEPATMLLLGTGLVGLAGAGRKKFFKKQ